jgi:ATP-dependent exoDNAse (exonuclease V) alpha subunit
MKTPMQELINQVEEWMLEDKEVLENPLVWSNYLLLEANQMIEVKSEFIEMCKEMLEKEKEQTIDFSKTCLNKAKDLDVLTAFLNVDKYYNETFNTK